MENGSLRELMAIFFSMNMKDRLGIIVFFLVLIGLRQLYLFNEGLGFIVIMIFVAFILGISIGGLNNDKESEDDLCGNDNIRREPWKYM
jgi:hypothetical protein